MTRKRFCKLFRGLVSVAAVPECRNTGLLVIRNLQGNSPREISFEDAGAENAFLSYEQMWNALSKYNKHGIGVKAE